MSTASFERPMHAVPDIPLTPTKLRCTRLLVLRANAYRPSTKRWPSLAQQSGGSCHSCTEGSRPPVVSVSCPG